MVILNRDPVIAARELSDPDLRRMLSLTVDVSCHLLGWQETQPCEILEWAEEDTDHAKWIISYAQFCATEVRYRFGKQPIRRVYRALRMPDVKVNPLIDLPSNPLDWQEHYRRKVAPNSVYPNLLWTKRYPPDWLAWIIYPNAIHY